MGNAILRYSKHNFVATPNIGFTLFLFETQNEQGKSLKYLLGNGPGSLKEQQRNEIHNTVIITPP